MSGRSEVWGEQRGTDVPGRQGIGATKQEYQGAKTWLTKSKTNFV